jgi:hypothetical protein
MVIADSYAGSGEKLRASLSNEDVSGANGLAAELLNSQTLRSRIAPVSG